MRIKSFLFLLLFCAFLAAYSVPSFPVDKKAVISELEQKYKMIDDFELEFNSRLFTPHGEQVTKSKYIMMKPDRYIIEAVSSDPHSLQNVKIYNGNKKYVYTPLAKKVYVSQSDRSGMFFSVEELKNRSNLTYVDETKLNGADVYVFEMDFDILNLQNPNKMTVYIGKDDGILRSVEEISGEGNKVSEMNVTKIETNNSIDANMFEFDVPEGVEVIERPVNNK